MSLKVRHLTFRQVFPQTPFATLSFYIYLGFFAREPTLRNTLTTFL